MSLTDDLNNILGNLRSSVPEIKGALIASTDGMIISSHVTSGDPSRMAAMIATALGLGKRICETFAGGTLTETSVSGTEGQAFIYSAGSKAVLGVIVAAGANVGLIHLECRDAAKKISQVLN